MGIYTSQEDELDHWSITIQMPGYMSSLTTCRPVSVLLFIYELDHIIIYVDLATITNRVSILSGINCIPGVSFIMSVRRRFESHL